MNQVRGLANFILVVGLVSWSLAFYLGPGKTVIWRVGEYGGLAVIVGLMLHILAFMLPSSGAQGAKRRRKGGAEPRKCSICGRPAVPDSNYCRYHTDEMRQSAREHTGPPDY